MSVVAYRRGDDPDYTATLADTPGEALAEWQAWLAWCAEAWLSLCSAPANQVQADSPAPF